MPIPRMLAAGAATAALTLGGLSMAAPAQAADAQQTSVGTTTATYTCQGPLGLTYDLPATWAVPKLPSDLEVGKPTGDIPLSGVLQLSGANILVDLLNAVYGLLGGTLNAVTTQVLVPLGAEQLGITLQGAVSTLAAATTGVTSSIGGVIPSFVPSQDGTYTIALPRAISLVFNGGNPVTCQLKPGTGGTTQAPLASYTVVRTTTTGTGTGTDTTGGGTSTGGTTTGGTTTPGTTTTGATTAAKSASSTTAAARSAKVRAGRSVRVKVAVAVPGPGTGTVYAYEKGRQLAAKPLAGGSASFVFKKAKAGSHTYRFVYQGTESVAGSEQSVTVKVAKATKHR
jgi:hypothetical protein